MQDTYIADPPSDSANVVLCCTGFGKYYQISRDYLTSWKLPACARGHHFTRAEVQLVQYRL